MVEGAKKRVLECCCSRVAGLSFSDWQLVMMLMMLAMIFVVNGNPQFDAEENDDEVRSWMMLPRSAGEAPRINKHTINNEQ